MRDLPAVPASANTRSRNGCLGVEEVELLRALDADGWSVAELAERFEVSRRTVYRYRNRAYVHIDIGGWVVTFRPRKDAPPDRITSWRRVKSTTSGRTVGVVRDVGDIAAGPPRTDADAA